MAKKNEKEKIIYTGVAPWMATFSDLVTLLLCFFVLMVAMSNVDQEKFTQMAAAFSGKPQVNFLSTYGSNGVTRLMGSGIKEMPTPESTPQSIMSEYEKKANQSMNDIREMSSYFKTYLAENNLEDSVYVESTDGSIDITFSESLLYDSGSADLKQDAIPVLNVIAEALAQYPESDIMIEGHADDRPISTAKYESNMYLSSARAIKVGELLMRNHSIDGRRIMCVGYGELRPIESNETPEGRAKNRRVEMKIVSKYSQN